MSFVPCQARRQRLSCCVSAPGVAAKFFVRDYNLPDCCAASAPRIIFDSIARRPHRVL